MKKDNGKELLAILCIVLAIVACIMSSVNKGGDYVIFTSDHLESIEKAIDTYGEDVTVGINKKGELIIQVEP